MAYKMLIISVVILAVAGLISAIIVVASIHSGIANIEFGYDGTTGMLSMKWKAGYKGLAKVLYSFVPFSITEMNGQTKSTQSTDLKYTSDGRCGINESYLIFAGNVIEPRYVPVMYGYPYNEDFPKDKIGKSLRCHIDTVNVRIWNKVSMPLIKSVIKKMDVSFPYTFND